MSAAVSVHIKADEIAETEIEAATASLPDNSPLRRFLLSMGEAGRRGSGVTALAEDAVLTPNQAAQALGMSRPHLLKFIRAGVLKAHFVGTHQRISYEDFMDFKQRNERASKEMAVALSTRPTHRRQLTLTAEQMVELDEL